VKASERDREIRNAVTESSVLAQVRPETLTAIMEGEAKTGTAVQNPSFLDHTEADALSQRTLLRAGFHFR
jgi:hypothetical protein